eukprot:TRINITY_DN2771_c0_g1_i2.p1 TRINITY_DN2771_c0_g1~~TRINITY_DN2771_c0_g1_i2.p1  ORF type:complete len:248 (-),score=28.83 TRINITY_DN2771_c0_g1_i2:1-744(-)
MSSETPIVAVRGDLIDRGKKDRSLLGRITFTVLRLAEPFLQYYMLTGLGITLLSYFGAAGVSHVGLTEREALLVAFSIAAVLKQICWVWFIGFETFPFAAAAAVAVYNAVINSINSLVAIKSPGGKELGTLEYAGLVLFVVGLVTEWGAEIQRLQFKSDPRHRHKIHTKGLFGLARHINYGGYTLWRTGYALATGSLIAAGLTFLFIAGDFARRAIPVLDEYMTKKYEAQWNNYKRRTPSKLFPGLY